MRPHWLRGYSQTDFCDTTGRTLPVVTEVPGVRVLSDDTGDFFATHRVIHLERDYWVSPEELASLVSEDEGRRRQAAQAGTFWAAITLLGAVFAVLTWLGWLPA